MVLALASATPRLLTSSTMPPLPLLVDPVPSNPMLPQSLSPNAHITSRAAVLLPGHEHLRRRLPAERRELRLARGAVPAAGAPLGDIAIEVALVLNPKTYAGTRQPR
eukprot:9474986-Pyramimonas_sp.AAC.2